MIKIPVRRLKKLFYPGSGSKTSFFLWLWLFYWLVSFPGPAAWCQTADSGLLLKQIEVQASAGWIDTGLEVKEGEKYEIVATGTISCQQGNPVADCGPDGLDLQTVQQPLTGQNLGALVGKVVKVLSIRKDSETGEEIRDEVTKVFFIGSHSRIEITLEGKLYLGVNDSVYADNSGHFTVSIFKRQTGEI
jgi:hypothetical protein